MKTKTTIKPVLVSAPRVVTLAEKEEWFVKDLEARERNAVAAVKKRLEKALVDVNDPTIARVCYEFEWLDNAFVAAGVVDVLREVLFAFRKLRFEDGKGYVEALVTIRNEAERQILNAVDFFNAGTDPCRAMVHHAKAKAWLIVMKDFTSALEWANKS